jgi:hypothetical protein
VFCQSIDTETKSQSKRCILLEATLRAAHFSKGFSGIAFKLGKM